MDALESRGLAARWVCGATDRAPLTSGYELHRRASGKARGDAEKDVSDLDVMKGHEYEPLRHRGQTH